MRHIPGAGLSLVALALASCASLGQTPEKVDTAANDAYVAIATAANAYEAQPGANIAKAENIKLQAWQALAVERNLYAVGKTGDLSALSALLIEAQALGH